MNRREALKILGSLPLVGAITPLVTASPANENAPDRLLYSFIVGPDEFRQVSGVAGFNLVASTVGLRAGEVRIVYRKGKAIVEADGCVVVRYQNIETGDVRELAWLGACRDVLISKGHVEK